MTMYTKGIRVQKVFKTTRLDEITGETNVARKEKKFKCGRKGSPFLQHKDRASAPKLKRLERSLETAMETE